MNENTPFVLFWATIGTIVSEYVQIHPLAGTAWGAFLGISLILVFQLIMIAKQYLDKIKNSQKKDDPFGTLTKRPLTNLPPEQEKEIRIMMNSHLWSPAPKHREYRHDEYSRPDTANPRERIVVGRFQGTEIMVWRHIQEDEIVYCGYTQKTLDKYLKRICSPGRPTSNLGGLMLGRPR